MTNHFWTNNAMRSAPARFSYEFNFLHLVACHSSNYFASQFVFSAKLTVRNGYIFMSMKSSNIYDAK